MSRQDLYRQEWRRLFLHLEISGDSDHLALTRQWARSLLFRFPYQWQSVSDKHMQCIHGAAGGHMRLCHLEEQHHDNPTLGLEPRGQHRLQ